ncbi:hypothetical protein AA14337_3320 [Acetobacter malorum DSM 14337]|uniref:Uncharacterized protein n=1 Tax=Acetobacter malorum DSM 14337 TaxID=1307910 RepID=A0ABQ0Q0X1_9PROT|nr:hypothetical protein AA14337_3320 [Acetobacter malorum DSM 14337]
MVSKSSVGNDVNSVGFSINSETIRIKTDEVIETESPASRMNEGRGTRKIASSASTPKARDTSVPGMTDLNLKTFHPARLMGEIRKFRCLAAAPRFGMLPAIPTVLLSGFCGEPELAELELSKFIP